MRAGRLVKLLRLLETRGRMTAPELATELEVSVRTVLRDMEELSGAGIPVYSMRGRGGGFGLLGGWRPLRLFSSDTVSPASTPMRATVRLSPRGRATALSLGRRVRVRRRSTTAAGREDWFECSVELDSLDSALGDLLALGAEVEVVRPLELRLRVADTALRIAELHGVSPDQGPNSSSQA